MAQTNWPLLISQFLLHRRIKVEALAADLGVRPSTVYRWLKGETEPSRNQKIKLHEIVADRSDFIMRGLIEHIDALDALATLLDADFRVVRTTRLHQAMSSYDPVEVYGRSCEPHLGPQMERILASLGGLKGYKERGIIRLELKLEVVRQPGEPGYKAGVRRYTVGNTVAVGDPRAPVGYLTSMRLVEGGPPAPPMFKTIDGELTSLRL